MVQDGDGLNARRVACDKRVNLYVDVYFKSCDWTRFSSTCPHG